MLVWYSWHSMKKYLVALFGLFLLASPLASNAATANDASMYVPYTGLYGYGTNMGYYGSQFQDQDVAQLAYNAGSRTIRPSLPDWLITGYGTDARITAFQDYAAMGMKDLTAFLGEPNDPAVNNTSGPDDRETKVFPGADEAAHTFVGLYQPVWLDAAKTQINPANTYANYVYKTVKEYGPYVKFWEIVNEPDFTYSSAGWEDPSSPDSWWNVNPNPNDLGNLKAPVFYYIRELRVAYDVIKTLQPNEYVATGGIGYASFLDAVMRNTDNPVDGSVTPEYPLRGGAYFDVLSYHSYPMYSLRHWDNGPAQDFVYTRQSDAAVDALLQVKTDMQTVLSKYGYGTTYPAKQWIVTETDMPSATVDGTWGSNAVADDYIIKAAVMAQANGIKQIYKYGLGEDGTATDSFKTMGIYGDITPATTTVANAPHTEQYKAFATVSSLLYGKTYDAAQTAALNLPFTVRGAAFKDPSGAYTYVLWAKTTTDESEVASATYTFPFAFSGTRREWDYSATSQTTTAGSTVTLGGSPSFFTASAATSATSAPYYVPPAYYPPIMQNIVIAPQPPIQQPSPVLGATRARVTAGTLNVRATAGGKLVNRAHYGDTGTVTGQGKASGMTWDKVAFDDGILGWVSALYLQNS